MMAREDTAPLRAGLRCTYPIMCFPVCELVEEFLRDTVDTSARAAWRRSLRRSCMPCCPCEP